MNKKVKKEKKETKPFTWFILGWFVMYFLGLFVFPIRYPNIDMNSQEYQSFMWLWFQLYLSLFGLGYLSKRDFLKGKMLFCNYKNKT